MLFSPSNLPILPADGIEIGRFFVVKEKEEFFAENDSVEILFILTNFLEIPGVF